jgi:hypothetical protein
LAITILNVGRDFNYFGQNSKSYSYNVFIFSFTINIYWIVLDHLDCTEANQVYQDLNTNQAYEEIKLGISKQSAEDKIYINMALEKEI